MAGEIIELGRGLTTLSGGTRTQVKTARSPWQVALKYPEPGKCGLCNKDDESKYIPGPGWKSFQNANTPYPYHRILIPDTCWEEEKLRALGGVETLLTAWQYAISELKRTRPVVSPAWIFTHIGYGSGQNFPHHHWHILEPATGPEYLGLKSSKMQSTIIGESAHFVTGLWGIKAAQVFIIPKSINKTKASDLFGEPSILRELADEASRLVELFNLKFGNPDYCLALDLSYDDDWFVQYTPILNNWGGTEFLAPYRGTPYTLPWPHEKTLEFLKS